VGAGAVAIGLVTVLLNALIGAFPCPLDDRSDVSSAAGRMRRDCRSTRSARFDRWFVFARRETRPG
jgi:hypothetical protein